MLLRDISKIVKSKYIQRKDMVAWEDYPTLQGWYFSLTPLRVDIIGDFAGRELFGIHGDSLLMHCISEAMVDYKGMYKILSRVDDRHGQPRPAHDTPFNTVQTVSSSFMPFMP